MASVRTRTGFNGDLGLISLHPQPVKICICDRIYAKLQYSKVWLFIGCIQNSMVIVKYGDFFKVLGNLLMLLSSCFDIFLCNLVLRCDIKSWLHALMIHWVKTHTSYLICFAYKPPKEIHVYLNTFFTLNVNKCPTTTRCPHNACVWKSILDGEVSGAQFRDLKTICIDTDRDWRDKNWAFLLLICFFCGSLWSQLSWQMMIYNLSPRSDR